MYDIIVIGGGCVGLSTAYKLNLRYPQKKILVLEKEPQLSAHQTGRNSGVIHSGIYYKPGSFKAKNCVDGRRELVAFAKEYKVDHDICGKVILATHESELAHMNKVYNNGLANGVEGIEIIDTKKVKEIEPYAEGIGAIYVPCTGIIDYVGLTVRLGEVLTAKFPQSKIMLGTEAKAFQKGASSTTVITNKGNFEGKYII
ncbi:MAG: FAD-dependent oxidoreductase, partial [Bacteroidota bacterium]